MVGTIQQHLNLLLLADNSTPYNKRVRGSSIRLWCETFHRTKTIQTYLPLRSISNIASMDTVSSIIIYKYVHVLWISLAGSVFIEIVTLSTSPADMSSASHSTAQSVLVWHSNTIINSNSPHTLSKYNGAAAVESATKLMKFQWKYLTYTTTNNFSFASSI